jgi:8-oxo-dGTP diphosphatase
VEISWENWVPKDRATLLFVVKGDQVLLIRKKRGLGAGKMNAPGGRMEGAETPHDGAVREVEEELCITPRELVKHGELSFQFVDGYSIFVHVFRASDYVGDPVETNEARPHWTPLARIPYDEMWADDALWVPILLRGGYFIGRFAFDGETMLEHHLVEVESQSALCH